MINNLEKKLEFIELMDEMKDIKRAIYLKNWSQETDAEHSFHVAMMVICFANDFSELNIEKCLKLALLHDVVEIYAWDTVLWDEKMEKTKDKREKDSIEKLNEYFWKIIPNFIDLINEYEICETKEAKFVKSLDWIAPIIQIVMEWWKSWKDWKLTSEKVKWRAYWKCLNKKLEKVLNIYFEKADKGKMFYIEK